MSTRPWYSSGHMVRMLTADLLLAMVAVALLVCNLRGDHAAFLPMIVETDEYPLPWAGSWRWDHGWPLLCLERRGPMVSPAVGARLLPVYGEIPRFPLRANPGEHWTFNVTSLSINALVALVVLGSTAYATRRWLQTGMRPFQVSLLNLLTLLAVPALVYLLRELPRLLPHVLLAAFFWLGIVCTIYAALSLVAKLSRRWLSRRI